LQEIFSTFGVPFLLKVKQNEPFSKVKDRIQKKLEIPDKEFEKVNIKRIMSRRMVSNLLWKL